MNQVKWDRRFLALAEHKAQWSKDRTKVGAVITLGNQDKYYGYNGFPPGIEDTEERLTNRVTKHQLVIHAEMNAILSANENLQGHTLYCTHVPCIRCAVHTIRSQISRVVTNAPTEQWYIDHEKELQLVDDIFAEAGIKHTLY